MQQTFMHAMGWKLISGVIEELDYNFRWSDQDVIVSGNNFHHSGVLYIRKYCASLEFPLMH